MSKICNYCVMDSTDPDIVFYGDAGCSNCKEARKKLHSSRKTIEDLHIITKQIKKAGKGKKYNCVIGVSGGVDSSFVAHMVKKMGLRPIAVHLDNGWDSEEAVSNIKCLLDKLDIDLYNYVADWQEFKDLQLSFLKASTPDSEIPTDHAIIAALYIVAEKYNIKYIIDGHNISSESILPVQWSQGHSDWKYIKSIQEQFGTQSLKTFPHISRWKGLYYDKIRKIERIHALDYIRYDKEKAKEILSKKYHWIDYGGKHHESFYTKFYQAYILPQKFGYDKRKAHLSSLIAAGQITREAALKKLEEPLYDPGSLEQDITYFIHKMNINKAEFDSIMQSPKKTYWDYPNYKKDWIFRNFGI